MFEEETSKPKVAYQLGDDLERWSVADLAELIASLRAEMARVEADMQRKKGKMTAAESLFKI